MAGPNVPGALYCAARLASARHGAARPPAMDWGEGAALGPAPMCKQREVVVHGGGAMPCPQGLGGAQSTTGPMTVGAGPAAPTRNPR